MSQTNQAAVGRLGPFKSALLAAVAFQMALELFVGAFLGFSYSPKASSAYASVAAMHAKFGMLQAFHYWDSALLIAESLILVVWLTWMGRFRAPFRILFWGSLLFFISAMGFQISGNLLPFDKHGVGTATVEASIAARAPAIGPDIAKLMLGGPTLGPQTLGIWFIAHIALTVLPIAALGLTIRDRDKLRFEITSQVAAAALVLAAIASSLVKSPLGSAATPVDYSSFNASVSWYVWPMHGAMQMMTRLQPGLGWIGFMAVPGLTFLGLMFLPLTGDKVPLGAIRGVLVFLGLFFGAGAVFFGGSFSPLVGTRDPAAPPRSSSEASTPIDVTLRLQGEKLFGAQGCANCHGAGGDAGGAGPSLKSVGLQHPSAAFFENYVHSPTSVDSQSTMPAFPNLSKTELSALAEYLRSKR